MSEHTTSATSGGAAPQTPAGGADRPRKRGPRPAVELTVLGSERLSPSLQRVRLGGEGFPAFAPNDHTDMYVKLIFADPALGLGAGADLGELRRTLPPEQVPVTRTYTVRRVDTAAGWLEIDFVLHGDEGLAGPWAAAAQPGDRLLLTGPGGGYSPDPTADAHLLAGDLSALPAIAAALEAMPADARGLAIIVAEDEADIIELSAPAGVEVIWTSGAAAVEPDGLAAAISAHPHPEGRVHVFAHGEREAIKAVRRLLRERDVPRSDISISGYWARGRTEDRFQAEKREPIGKIED